MKRLGDDAADDWVFRARHTQLPPPDLGWSWLFLGGRGTGKSHSMSAAVHMAVRAAVKARRAAPTGCTRSSTMASASSRCATPRACGSTTATATISANAFPLVVTAMAALPVRSSLLDGEAIISDESGLAVFGSSQSACSSEAEGPESMENWQADVRIHSVDPSNRRNYRSATRRSSRRPRRHTREEHEKVVAEFERRLHDTGLINEVCELPGFNLVCWCKPLPWHGDLLLGLANK